MSVFRSFGRYLARLPRLYSIGGVMVIVVLAVVGVQVATRSSTPVASVVAGISHVHISSVASLSSATGPLPVTGKVTSLSHATILAQTSGEIVTLDHALGDRVAAGEVIATFENGSQQAAVVQAEGGYEAAQAALAKTTGSTAANSTITSAQAATSARTAQTSALAALQSAYAALDDAVHTKADTLFSNPRSVSPSITLTIPNSQLAVTLANERGQLESILSSASSLSNAPSNVDTAIDSMTAYAQTVQTFVNDLVTAVNEAQPNQSMSNATIAGYQVSVGAARSEVVAAIGSLAAAKSAYDNAQSGAQTASNTATAGSQNDIASAQANVKQALGALDAAKANLEKTIIRSPISGTIVSLAISRGDFVSSFSQVADVSNPSALEIDTNVTSDDAKTLSVGGAAVINDTTKGVITSVAPALDPTTGKILVKVGITGSQSSLTDGDTVSVSLSRAASAAQPTHALKSIVIPIAAAKITPQGPIVFTVASSTLVSHPITLGSILGDHVVVVSGLTPETDIVTDARGLTDGQTVVVDAN